MKWIGPLLQYLFQLLPLSFPKQRVMSYYSEVSLQQQELNKLLDVFYLEPEIIHLVKPDIKTPPSRIVCLRPYLAKMLHDAQLTLKKLKLLVLNSATGNTWSSPLTCTFQHLIDILPALTICCSLVDVIIHSSNWGDQLYHLKKVLE